MIREISDAGIKDVLSINIGENESSKYWGKVYGELSIMYDGRLSE